MEFSIKPGSKTFSLVHFTVTQNFNRLEAALLSPLRYAMVRESYCARTLSEYLNNAQIFHTSLSTKLNTFRLYNLLLNTHSSRRLLSLL